jgi:HD-GYP domain-containing protein (c-di-GMP phosphodiesterase class II)
MRSHVYNTYQTLESFEVLSLVSQWGSLHQERLNGTGYPFGLSADDLPLGARIMAVADVFTALTEDRPYRKGMDTTSAMTVLQTMADNGELDVGLIARVFRHYEMLNSIRQTAQREAMNEYHSFQSDLERNLKNSSLLFP